jgi:excisionase family DNA binding protein
MPATTGADFPNGEVLTLAETAHYLRVPEQEVARLVREQGLPGRKLGDDWRFLKSAVQDWLRAPPSKKEGLLMQIGAFQDDPHLGEMLEEIHKQRGRRDTEVD